MSEQGAWTEIASGFSIPTANMLDALVPNDRRVENKFVEVCGFKYHYMLATPAGTPTATVVLCHGWPDLGMGWRYQVPFLLSLNLRVVVPDMLGYGQTDAPDAADEYTLKKMSAHVAEIIKHVTPEPVILGGHDWGAVLVWRVVQYYPELIRGFFSICVPYLAPSPVKMSLPEMVERLPNFRYQLKLVDGTAETIVGKSPERIRAFFNGMYGGTTPDGRRMFNVTDGVVEENLDDITQSPLMTKEITDFYVQQYKNGLHAPCNWYRTRLLNADDEAVLAANTEFKYQMPAMLLMADKDAALPPWMAEGMEKYFAAGFKKELLTDCTHWAMIQKPVEVNEHIGDFLKIVLGSELKAAL